MAVSLSTPHRFIYASFLPSKPSSKSPILTKTLIFPPNSSSKSHHLLSLSISSPLALSSPLLPFNRPNFHAFSYFVNSLRDSAHSMNEGQQDHREDLEAAGMGPGKVSDSVGTLIRYYKDAVLAGDHQIMAEIETAFYRLEAKKNELIEKVSTLSGEITSGKERYIRLQADFDNFRKRSEKERLSVRSDAQGEVIESLLAMVDSFERAKQQIIPETEREKQIDTSYQGIYKQFVEIMRSLQVAAVATVGKPFDPTLHEAIAREESKEFKEGIVIQECRRGFLLGGRLLRPAMVKVSSGPGMEATLKSTEQIPTSKEQAAAAAGVDEH